MSPTSYQTAPSRVIKLYHLNDEVGGEGFEPSKAVPTDLQSAPFAPLGNPPKVFNLNTKPMIGLEPITC